MRKFVVLLLIIGVAVVIACLYGVGHDQVTYSISPEYYTKFKFIQFNLADSAAALHMTQPRSAVVMVGVKSTWWMGIGIGVVLGLFALAFRDADTMFQSALQAIGITLVITIITAVIGGIYGHNTLAKTGVSWWLPPNLVDKPAFITVGAIHNASYLGGAIGLVAGIIFLLIKNNRLRRRTMNQFALFTLFFLMASFTSWSQTEPYKVYAIRFASCSHPWPISDWADKAPNTDSVNIDFMVWLIKGKDKNILVDAGFLNDLPNAKEFGVVKYVRPDSVLSKVALKPEDITDIIVSHPHWDHIDGVSLFPNAHVWIQKEDYNYYVGASWQKGGNNGGYNKRDVRTIVDRNMAGKLTLIDGDDKEILPGIKVYTGSRHTFNSQYVLVNTGANKVILASDNIWIYYSLDHLAPPSEGGTWDPAGFVKSMQRMKGLVSNTKYIIPGHDSKIFTLFPKVAEGVAQIE